MTIKEFITILLRHNVDLNKEIYVEGWNFDIEEYDKAIYLIGNYDTEPYYHFIKEEKEK